MSKQIDWFEILIGLMFLVLAIGVVAIGVAEIMYSGASNEEIKQLKQSDVEIQQECEVYRNRCKEYENRCLELENILEGTGLVVDNCECR